MSYVPPHKRHTEGTASPKPTPVPKSLVRKSLPLGELKRKGFKNIVYAQDAVSKWFTVGLPDHSLFSSLVTLQPVNPKSFSLVLAAGRDEGTNKLIDTPWHFVTENVMQDLISSFEHVKCEMEEAGTADVKPCLVARFGRVLFSGNSSSFQEYLKSNPSDETLLRKMKQSFSTDISSSFMEYIENLVVEKLGIVCVQEKELYYVLISDTLRPDTTVVCKCVVGKDSKKIQLHKIELDALRHMVADISFLGKSLDLRLMLGTKKVVMALSDETNGIKDIIGSAILDSEVRGGLRWPFGKDSSGGRYAVSGVWHTTAKSYRNSSIRFKLRRADRFDFPSSKGEVSLEIFMKMPGIISHLRKQTIEENVFKMLEDNLKLIWDHCLLDADHVQSHGGPSPFSEDWLLKNG